MCLFPQNASKQEFGKIKFNPEGELKIPCGKCTECISKRAAEWATRARHEISLNTENCFITLTYDEQNLPSIFVVKDEFQKFIKRLRKHTKIKLRYMVSHEYGSQTFRPHHHAIIFGYNFPNQKFLKQSGKGTKLFTSELLSKLWTKGFHSIGTANEKTAYYIASYALKGKKHQLTDPKTGELVSVSDSMDVSKSPAIGLEFFKENQKQIVYSENIPRYYQKLLQECGKLKEIKNPTQKEINRLEKLKTLNPELYEMFENERIFQFKNRSQHEIYAKYIIDQQKLCSKNEFRELDAHTLEEQKFYSKELLTKRDEYHAQTKD